MPATVSQKLASMIGMSVNTFCDRHASSNPRQFRTDPGRSLARAIRPLSSSATQASASPRGDSAQPSPVPPPTCPPTCPFPGTGIGARSAVAPASTNSAMSRTDSSASPSITCKRANTSPRSAVTILTGCSA
jgi:hypothetical protein